MPIYCPKCEAANSRLDALCKSCGYKIGNFSPSLDEKVPFHRREPIWFKKLIGAPLTHNTKKPEPNDNKNILQGIQGMLAIIMIIMLIPFILSCGGCLLFLFASAAALSI